MTVTSIRTARLAIVTPTMELPFKVPSARLEDQIAQGLQIAFESGCGLAVTFETETWPVTLETKAGHA